MKVLISGASSGIGSAAAVRFAQAGWQVVLTGRAEDRLTAVLNSLDGEGHEMVLADVLDWAEDPKRIPAMGSLDAMVWSAGVCKLAAGMLLRQKVIRETLAINLEAPLVVTSHLYRTKALVDGAQIVWLGSESAHEAGEGFSIYAASKGGLGAAARVLTKEYARRSVALHCIEPGTVNTPMTDALIEQFDGLKDGYADNMETPEAIAEKIFDLCQP